MARTVEYEYRKKTKGLNETYVKLLDGCPIRKFVVRLMEPIPFLATTTRIDYHKAVLYHRMDVKLEDAVMMVNCDGGWERISEEEYEYTLDRVIMRIR